MSNQWFRFYAEFSDDPKVQMMSECMQRRLAMLFCSHCKESSLSDASLAFAWRISLSDVEETKRVFLDSGLIREDWRLINWDKRQFVSDSSSERVKKYRDKRQSMGLKRGSAHLSDSALYDRDGNRCIYCMSPLQLCIDHIYPIALGGTDDYDNLGVACKACNSGKSGRTPEMAKKTIVSEIAKARYERFLRLLDGNRYSHGPEQNRTEQITEQKKPLSAIGFQMFFEAVGCFDDKDRGKLTQVADAYCRASGMDVAAGAKHMISRWREIELAADKLEWQYGSSFKFFMGGKWDKPETWPWKPGQSPPKKRSMREDPEFIKAQKVMEDMDNARRKSEAYRKEVADRVAGANDNRTEAHTRPSSLDGHQPGRG